MRSIDDIAADLMLWHKSYTTSGTSTWRQRLMADADDLLQAYLLSEAGRDIEREALRNAIQILAKVQDDCTCGVFDGKRATWAVGTTQETTTERSQMDWPWTSINRMLQQINRKVDSIMATEQDLQDTMNAMSDGVNAAVAELDKLFALFSALPAAGAVTQAQLDALNAQAQATKDVLAAAVAKDAPPA